MDFTLPYYTAGLGVAVPTGEPRWRAIFRTLFSLGFLQAVAILLGLAMCVGFLIWLLERRKTEHFSGGARGLGTGVWWSATAMTQAGAGEQAPRRCRPSRRDRLDDRFGDRSGGVHGRCDLGFDPA